MNGRVLIIAGSDSGGGAGIQGDIKTVTALGGFAATALTALTAQNTLGVHEVAEVDTGFVRSQIRVVLEDIGADCLKTGMLHSVGVVRTVCETISTLAPDIPLVADPVMVAKGGAPLLDADAIRTVREHVLPLATLITPNIPEAECLLSGSISSLKDMKEAAGELRAMGPDAVLVKGGHMDGDQLCDVLLCDDGLHLFETERIDTVHTHGTGCATASAIAAGIAQGLPLDKAVRRAQAYVVAAIRTAPGYGSGQGPIDHSHCIGSFAA